MLSLKNMVLKNSGSGMAVSARDSLSELLNSGNEVIIIDPEKEFDKLKNNLNLSNDTNILDFTNLQRGV